MSESTPASSMITIYDAPDLGSGSLKANLPPGYDSRRGIRSLRAHSHAPISVLSMTGHVFTDRQPLQDLNTGNVYASRVLVRIWGNGSWWFGAWMSDTSVIYGDNYAIGFSFEEGGYAAVHTGVLGADETSTHQHQRFAIGGYNAGLQRDYPEVIRGGCKFRLHRSGDLDQALSDLGDDLKWIGRHSPKFEKSYDSTYGGSDPPRTPDQYPPEHRVGAEGSGTGIGGTF
jgi:hypothetical protein